MTPEEEEIIRDAIMQKKIDIGITKKAIEILEAVNIFSNVNIHFMPFENNKYT
jgi:hypothetical protein